MEAVAAYAQSVALAPTHASSLNDLGNALREQGKLAEAIAQFRRAISVDARLSRAHGALGQALMEQGKLGEARASIPCCCRRSMGCAPR